MTGSKLEAWFSQRPDVSIEGVNSDDISHNLCLIYYWLKNKLMPEDNYSGAHAWFRYSSELCTYDCTSEGCCVFEHARAHSSRKIVSFSEMQLN